MDNLIQDFEKIISNYDETYFLSDFEKKLSEIQDTENTDMVSELVYLLDDDFDFDELMFSIIHTIESFEDEIYVNRILATIPKFIEKSPRWASMIFLRIINSESSNHALMKQIVFLDEIQKKSLKKLFINISNLGEEFKVKLKFHQDLL